MQTNKLIFFEFAFAFAKRSPRPDHPLMQFLRKSEVKVCQSRQSKTLAATRSAIGFHFLPGSCGSCHALCLKNTRMNSCLSCVHYFLSKNCSAFWSCTTLQLTELSLLTSWHPLRTSFISFSLVIIFSSRSDPYIPFISASLPLFLLPFSLSPPLIFVKHIFWDEIVSAGSGSLSATLQLLLCSSI